MDIMFTSYLGCDSMVVLNIDGNGSTFTEGEELFVCPGGEVFYKGKEWTCEDAGLQDVRYSRVNAPVCDSAISFFLTCVTVEKGRSSSAKHISGHAPFGLEVWPQPAGTFVWVNSKCNHSFDSVTVWNNLGVTMDQHLWPDGNDAMKLDIAYWLAGTYFLQVVGQEGATSEVVRVIVN